MATAESLVDWAYQATDASEPLPEVARRIWEAHEEELTASGPLFYTWQTVLKRVRPTGFALANTELRRTLGCDRPHDDKQRT